MAFVAWFLGSLLVGALGKDRAMGFWGFFFLALLTSPILGLLVLLLTKTVRMPATAPSSPSR